MKKPQTYYNIPKQKTKTFTLIIHILMNTSAYKKLVSFLPPHLLEFALQDEDTRLDIIEHKLDTYEIETLV